MPEPFKIILPGPGKKPGSYTTPYGQVVKVEPLKRKLLPTLEDREEYIRNLKENNTFDTGKGGLPHYTAFTTDDGLPMNWVRCAAVDKRGHIWFGTFGQGISKYDGKNFTNFSGANYVIETIINSILEDKAGNIWIGTQGRGVSRYDGLKFTSYWREFGSSARIKNMAEGDSGKIWINTEAGIKYYDPGSDSIFSLHLTQPELSGNSFICLKADKAGNIWLGSSKGAICCNPEKNQITEILTEANGLASDYIYCIHEDKAGKLWFGTNKGISCYDALTKVKPKNYTTKDGLISNVVRNIVEDSKGKLWCGTAGGAVSCFEKIDDNERFTSFYLPFTSYNLLTANLLTIDSSDKLWIGTHLLN
jgi:ligand-binding sensor domain-containing protein